MGLHGGQGRKSNGLPLLHTRGKHFLFRNKTLCNKKESIS